MFGIGVSAALGDDLLKRLGRVAPRPVISGSYSLSLGIKDAQTYFSQVGWTHMSETEPQTATVYRKPPIGHVVVHVEVIVPLPDWSHGFIVLFGSARDGVALPGQYIGNLGPQEFTLNDMDDRGVYSVTRSLVI